MTTSIGGTTGVTFPDLSVQPIAAGAYTFGFKNRIINGAMVIDQRNSGAVYTSPASNAYQLDRWKCNVGGGGFDVQQNAGAVTPPAGFSYYYGVTSTAVTAASNYNIRQIIEGFNTADLAFGTASAKTITLSFWVYSSLTGTFGGSIQNSAANRSYVYSYTIASANTWQQVTATIPGDTSGTWIGATNGTGLVLYITYSAAAGNVGAAGSWTANDYRAPTGQTNVLGTNGATFYITGVQLETGSTATSFDVRSYPTELMMCQRYYEPTDTTARDVYGSGFFNTTTSVLSFWRWSVEKRAVPSLTASSTAGGVITVNYVGSGAQNSAASSITFSVISTKSSRVDLTVASTVTAGSSALLSARGDSGYFLSASAEL
jgi:hypothetical protein